jgi:hypothetical protein
MSTRPRFPLAETLTIEGEAPSAESDRMVRIRERYRWTCAGEQELLRRLRRTLERMHDAPTRNPFVRTMTESVCLRSVVNVNEYRSDDLAESNEPPGFRSATLIAIGVNSGKCIAGKKYTK